MKSKTKKTQSTDSPSSSTDHERKRSSSQNGPIKSKTEKNLPRNGRISTSTSPEEAVPHSSSGLQGSSNNRMMNKTLLFLGVACCGVLNMLHTSSLFENDRHFSHLSDLEREMTFRTEMGFYYSHYKTMVEAKSFVVGLNKLLHNNITEYPNVINSLQRFNVMPEVVIGGLYRGLMSFSRWAEDDLQECYKVSRGPGLRPVWSCDGFGVAANFYLWCVWTMAGATGGLIFLSGALLSNSLLGGCVSALCFFFNHGEATRVMWAPPLRETFGFPFSLLFNLIVTQILRMPKAHYIQPLYVALISYAYLVSWQFAQFTVMLTVMIVYFLHTIEVIRPLPMMLVLMGTLFGFTNCIVSMFANRMLMTSLLAGCLLALLVMYVFMENVFNWFPAPFNKSMQVSFIVLATIAGKMELSNLLGTDEDSHVFKIFKAKFTNFSDFDTLLYTCSGEFDFLPSQTVLKLSQTFLIPIAFAVVGAVGSNMFFRIKDNLTESFRTETAILPRLWRGIDPGIVYNLLMLFAYSVLAFLIMRLKLFLTPQLCIIASLITCHRQYFKMLNRKEIFYGALAMLVAGMSVRGARNVMEQRATRGEYLNTNLEELLDWVAAETIPESVFAGTMPTMANLMLSTRRPVVNHPHYETADSRWRTKQVYTVFSRRTSQQVYSSLLNLGVNYLVLEESWCFSRSKPGCNMVDIWDVEEPENKNEPALCPQLYNHSPTPFHRVFVNDGYVVLQVPSKYVQIPPPKTLKS